MAGVVQRSVRERWEAKVSPEPNSGCWIWIGALDGHGYGQLRIAGKNVLATHVALKLAERPRPFPAAVARHKCDNPSCVNSAHLEWGTQQDNMRDAAQRGRANLSGLAVRHQQMRDLFAKRVPKNCEHCGVEFRPRPNQVRDNKHFFCSRDCTIAWQKETYTGRPIASWGGK
jgi:hypothetical protein